MKRRIQETKGKGESRKGRGKRRREKRGKQRNIDKRYRNKIWITKVADVWRKRKYKKLEVEELGLNLMMGISGSACCCQFTLNSS